MPAIVALVPPDTKATRRIDKTPLNPNGRKLRKFEKDGEAKLYEALQKWGRALFRGVTADTVALLTARLDDPEFNKPLRDVLIMFLQDVADAGAEHGREQVERVFMGVKRIPDVAAGAVDWTAANADAAQWAIEYGYQLIGGITDTTRAQIAREIRYFVDNGITINQLRDRLMAGNLFSRSRAEAIAITEVTRAFASGNEAAWRTSKVVEGKEWQTAYDEIAAKCPICGPLHGMIVKLDQPFVSARGSINRPPAHPRCRCYTLPVVMGDTEVLSPGGLPEWGIGGAGATVAQTAPIWKPAMSRAEAEAWAANSVYKDDVYHVTKGKNNERLMNEGFDLRNRSGFGRVFGDGVYVTPSAEDAQFWADYAKQNDWSVVLGKDTVVTQKIKLNITNPYVVNVSADKTPHEIYQDIFSALFGNPDYEEYMIDQEIEDRSHAMNRLLTDRGYDALSLISPGARRDMIDGSQIIIFRPRQVVIIK